MKEAIINYDVELNKNTAALRAQAEALLIS
jgi:hypothetical protein